LEAFWKPKSQGNKRQKDRETKPTKDQEGRLSRTKNARKQTTIKTRRGNEMTCPRANFENVKMNKMANKKKEQKKRCLSPAKETERSQNGAQIRES